MFPAKKAKLKTEIITSEKEMVRNLGSQFIFQVHSLCSV